MAHLNVVQAVEARLRANFDRCPIRVENDAEGLPDGGGPWIKLDFPYSRSEQATIGSPESNRFHEEGAFRVVLNVEAGAGTYEGRGWLDEIAGIFRSKVFDGVRTYAPQPASTDDRNDAAGYFRLSMAVPYDFSLNG